jgi:SAM-dependent methyltransferase
MNQAAAMRATEPRKKAQVAPGRCPACGCEAESGPFEEFHGASLYACAECDLHFWHPVSMPDAAWYERAYQGRDQTEMPLEPGHRFFLDDPKAPKRGRLLDLGCGVGNFLAAVREGGFEVTGIEMNRNAVQFAHEHYRLPNVFAMRPEEFCRTPEYGKFEVVTFFEVLEHQEDPHGFLAAAKQCLAAGGYVALSVPNRNRWQKGIETLDYPPNHLTRWSPLALANFLARSGFEVLSMKEEPLSVRRAANVLSMGLRTGLAAQVAGEPAPMLADLAEMEPLEMERAMKRLAENPRQRLTERLVRWKNLALVPAAAVALPYLRLRRYKGLYLYCLARQKTSLPTTSPEDASA